VLAAAAAAACCCCCLLPVAAACVGFGALQDAGTQKDFFLDVQSFKELKE
jgi:hypothetical protein